MNMSGSLSATRSFAFVAEARVVLLSLYGTEAASPTRDCYQSATAINIVALTTKSILTCSFSGDVVRLTVMGQPTLILGSYKAASDLLDTKGTYHSS